MFTNSAISSFNCFLSVINGNFPLSLSHQKCEFFKVQTGLVRPIHRKFFIVNDKKKVIYNKHIPNHSILNPIVRNFMGICPINLIRFVCIPSIIEKSLKYHTQSMSCQKF